MFRATSHSTIFNCVTTHPLHSGLLLHCMSIKFLRKASYGTLIHLINPESNVRNDKLLTMHETPELTFMLQCIQSCASKHDTTVADDLIHWPFFYTLILKHRVWHHVHEALTHTAVPSLPSDIKHA